ncbi:hypothetical protein BGW37DRAFT_486195 [Umbelopsis sp. PMI_123]|nr:hypothetical protein BGW37DRAFT_486195 [Umbelopsis sp. PMI_123]
MDVEVDNAHTEVPSPPKLCTRLATPSKLQMVTIYNPIQLAAISNYKLAQLTFTTPDSFSLLKTALIKNMLEQLYEVTPPEWLDQMTRWEFFSPESLADMSQKGLEEIFAQYIQAIESSQSLSPVSPVEEEFWTDDVDWDDTTVESTNKRNSLFSQPNETLESPEASIPSMQENQFQANKELPLKDSQTTTVSIPPPPPPPDDKPRKPTTNPYRNRLSWGSELVSSSSPSQYLASELMSLFDMEFKVDIHINTAPKLPELPFKSSQNAAKGLASERHSIMSLVNELETITVEDLEVRTSSPLVSFPPPPSIPPPADRRTARRSSSLASNGHTSWTTRKPIDSSIPKRSSSLSVASSPRVVSQVIEKPQAFTNVENSKRNTAYTQPDGFNPAGQRSSSSDDLLASQNKKLKKKSSFRHLADLMTLKKPSSNSPYSTTGQTKSSVSSSWISLPDLGSEPELKSQTSSQASVSTIQSELIVAKPLPASPSSSLNQSPITSGNPEISSRASQTPMRSSSLRQKHAKKRRSAVMEPTAKRATTAPAGYAFDGATSKHTSSQSGPISNVLPIGDIKRKRDKSKKEDHAESHGTAGLFGSNDQDHSNHRNSILAHRRSLTPAGLDMTDGIPVEDPGFVTIGKGIGNFGGATNQHKESNANATGKFIKRMVSLGRAMRVRNSIIA